MKKILIFVALTFSVIRISAQESNKIEKPKVDVKKKAGDRLNQMKERTSTTIINKPADRIEAATDKAVDKALDKVSEDFMGIFKKKNKKTDSLNTQLGQTHQSVVIKIEIHSMDSMK